LYAELIQELADLAGLNSTNNWEWCNRQNATYHECPVSKYADQDEYSMVVATHNPSNLAMERIEIKVPYGGYKVEQFS
jgi:hypothetical protein